MMRNNLENKIRLNAVLIYFIVAAACGGIILYIYNLNERAAQQKENIEQYNMTLVLTNDLISSVQKAQSVANLYLFSNKRSYLLQFQALATSIDQRVDSLVAILSEQTLQYATLEDVVPLLHKKEATIAELAKQFDEYSALDTVDYTFLRYEPIVKTDSMIVITTQQDTIVPEESKTGFWKKLGSLFSSSPSKELGYSVVTTTQINTLTSVALDTTAILSDVRKMSEKTSKSYSRKIKSIEQQLAMLIVADQSLSEEISLLLIKLHQQTLDSTLEEVQKSELLLRKNYRLSLVFAAIAMLLVLFFIFLIISDVGRGRATREALEVAKKRTEDLMNSRHELLLSVSHDIKAPLTSILGYLDLWGKEEYAVAPKQQRWLASMQNSGEHILSLLANLLDFSRLERRKLQISKSNFDVDLLCKEVAEMFAPLAQQKGLAFEYKCAVGKLRNVYSDRLKFKQIAINLISNAIKYTHQGKVSVELTEQNDSLSLRISDTGVGMGKDFVESIFAPFARAENVATVEGSGLGLYVVKGLADILQGEIVIHSELNVGTTVELALPVEAAVENAVGAECEKQELPVCDHCKVLAVDDDSTLLAMLGEMLQSMGGTATLCRNRQEFKEQIARLPSFDLVLTDMHMGAISGKDILRMTREKSSSIPVLIMTAYGDYSLDKATADGFSGYLAKPFSLHTLASLLGKPSDCNDAAVASNGNFADLLAMFDNDRAAVQNILNVFAEDTLKHVGLLRKYVEDNDFGAAQALCHKMHPMFVQLGENDLASVLRKMDALRGKSAGHYPQWKEELTKFIGKTANLLKKIKEFLKR
ncbi:MAG: response regulator [Prevotellaceae bacterium]|jgi:signal transduction histidine kinase/FixJ family two-component response regulator|nr:response regulator [Prevotellaceae bacterium]